MLASTHRRREFSALLGFVWIFSMGVLLAQPSPAVTASGPPGDPTQGPYTPQEGRVQVERVTIDESDPVPDLETVIGQLCTTVSSLKANLKPEDLSFGSAERIERVCAKRSTFDLKKYEPGAPVSFYAPGLCDAVEAGRDSVMKQVSVDLTSKLMEICDLGTPRAHVPGLSGLGLNIVNGFSDFLKERAEEELVVYAVDRIGRRLCGKNTATCSVPDPNSGECALDFDLDVDAQGKVPAPTWSGKGGKLHFHELFPKACCTVFPEGIDAEMDFDALTSGGATKALREDIQYIPARVLQHIHGGPGASDEQKAWVRILESLVVEAKSFAKGESPLDFLERVAERLDEARAGGCMQIKCDLTNPAGRTPPCVSLLLIEVGREGADRFKKSAKVNLSIWLDKALGSFCKNYGNLSEDAACVIDKNPDPNVRARYLGDWHPKLKRFAESFRRLAEVQAAIDAARKQGSFQSEIAKRSLPDVAASLDATIQVLADILEDNKIDEKRVSFIRATSRGIAALLADDVPGLQQALVELVEAAPGGSLSPALRRTLKFTAALAAAKDRGEVNTIITEAALPLRSYRAKYASKPDRLWTINAYVGYLFASQRNGRRDEDTVSSSEYATSLSAPVGIDVTLGHSSRGRHHFGMMASLIDPLAMTTETSGEGGVEASWRSILAPGLFGRWGVARSPVSILLGGVYRPGLESSETCGSDPCWRGATQVGLSVAVDIPLMVVH